MAVDVCQHDWRPSSVLSCVRCGEARRREDVPRDAGVTQLHEVMSALVHTHVASDPQASPEGFRRARELGLIESVVNPTTTPLGRGVLRALGYQRG